MNSKWFGFILLTTVIVLLILFPPIVITTDMSASGLGITHTRDTKFDIDEHPPVKGDRVVCRIGHHSILCYLDYLVLGDRDLRVYYGWPVTMKDGRTKNPKQMRGEWTGLAYAPYDRPELTFRAKIDWQLVLLELVSTLLVCSFFLRKPSESPIQEH